MFRQSWTEDSSKIDLTTDRIFHLKDVSVNYDTIYALKSVNLHIGRGEILFVTGSSGAGKTTLMKVLSGDIRTPGVNLSPSLFVAEVFQDMRLLHDKTCRENLFMSYDSLQYKTREEFVQDMMDLSRVLGVEDRISLKIRDANGGLKQKVAILRALLARPDVLLADEPTSSLDQENVVKVFDVLNMYNARRGMTLVWATHNTELIRSFSGRIVHLEEGRIIERNPCFTL